MAFLDLRRMVRNYLPLKYREDSMESFGYSLVSAYEDLVMRIDQDRREHEAQQRLDLTSYSFSSIQRRIWDTYSLAYNENGLDGVALSSRIALYEYIYGRIVHVRFGTHYSKDTNYHYGRIKDFFPAGILINIQYD